MVPVRQGTKKVTIVLNQVDYDVVRRALDLVGMGTSEFLGRIVSSAARRIEEVNQNSPEAVRRVFREYER
jgi:hypothetical protein